MGTRGFIGLTDDTRTVTIYNHFDSYPTGLGVWVAQFVRDADLDKAAEQFKAAVVVDEQVGPTPEQRAVLERKHFDGLDGDWYSILREFQGQLGEYLNAGFLPTWHVDKPDAMLTSTDSWLEYGYRVDFTTQTVDVYKISYRTRPTVVKTYSFDDLKGKTDEEISALMSALEEVLV